MNKIHYIFFTITFALKAFIDVIFVANDINKFNNTKYIFMVCAIILLWIDKKFNEKKNGKKEQIFLKEYINIIIIILLFLFISMICILISGYYTTETVKEIFYLSIAPTYAFLLLNTISKKEMDLYFSTLLLCFGGAYSIEIFNELVSGKFELISFYDSYSPFESSFMAGPAMSLFIYFLYKKNRIKEIISFIFVFMTFKRLSLVFAILLIILSNIWDLSKKVNIKTINFLKIFFILMPIFIYFFLREPYISEINRQFNIDIDKILMGRSSILNSVIATGFNSYGYGSTTIVVKKLYPWAGNLHLDLVKIFMETSIVGLIVFVNNLWNIAGRNRFAIVVLLFEFLNLLTSHSLSGPFSWIMTYLIIGSISRDNCVKE
ncbi:O-antigen ligase family protein [Paraclostridium sordellii]|uniref:O-antigen ligase family protein n=1 Tax=Paraclostridium sordellii TaxID=1505 RepID=UPI000E541A1A|nr:O-antigen ligase family protein [Paeniclostridium sordellii]RGX08017.1 O-antigen ligase domain-containing protein [Paeniclostridium sordellii]